MKVKVEHIGKRVNVSKRGLVTLTSSMSDKAIAEIIEAGHSQYFDHQNQQEDGKETNTEARGNSGDRGSTEVGGNSGNGGNTESRGNTNDGGNSGDGGNTESRGNTNDGGNSGDRGNSGKRRKK